jgi:hypothetical protein
MTAAAAIVQATTVAVIIGSFMVASRQWWGRN